EQTPNAIFNTLSLGGISLTNFSIANILAVVAIKPALPTSLNPTLLPILCSPFEKYLRIKYTIGNAPDNIIAIFPAFSNALKLSSLSAIIGSNPQVPKIVVNNPVKISTTENTNTSLIHESKTLPKIINIFIIMSEKKYNPIAVTITNIINGNRFINTVDKLI